MENCHHISSESISNPSNHCILEPPFITNDEPISDKCHHHTANPYITTNNDASTSPYLDTAILLSSVPNNVNKNNNSSETNTHASVVNLSNRQLTTHQIKILERGMKFCPTPGEPDISELHDDLDKLHVRLKRYLHFHKLSPPDNSTHTLDITVTPTPDPHQPF